MANDLALLEAEFQPRLPAFAEVLKPTGLTAERIVRTVLIACEKTPKLLQCRRQTVINSAMTGAVLGLEMDGWSGQGFIIPYGDIAQFQIGYKGYPTIAARSNMTVKAEAVRERDHFRYQDGTVPYIEFRKAPGSREARGKIVGAWAVYTAANRPPYLVFMGIDDILAIKAKSAGARKAESPWNDVNGPGFEAMCAKTAVRQAGRFCPIVGIQRGIVLEDQQDMGRAVYMRPDGAIEDEGVLESPYPDRLPPPDGAPVDLDGPYAWIIGTGDVKRFHTADEWENFVLYGLERATPEQAASARARNMEHLKSAPDQATAAKLLTALGAKAGA